MLCFLFSKFSDQLETEGKQRTFKMWCDKYKRKLLNAISEVQVGLDNSVPLGRLHRMEIQESLRDKSLLGGKLWWYCRHGKQHEKRFRSMKNQNYKRFYIVESKSRTVLEKTRWLILEKQATEAEHER